MMRQTAMQDDFDTPDVVVVKTRYGFEAIKKIVKSDTVVP